MMSGHVMRAADDSDQSIAGRFHSAGQIWFRGYRLLAKGESYLNSLEAGAMLVLF